MPQPPDKALSIMVERSGTQLDPYFLKIFINMIGVYPIGTLVMLSSKELGLVYESNQLFVSRPRVMVITDRKGNKISGKVVDLTEKNEQGDFKFSIIKTMDPNKYKINLAEYMM